MDSWPDIVSEEFKKIAKLKVSILAKICEFIDGDRSTSLVELVQEEIHILDNILNQYNDKLLLLNSYYDKAHKLSTLVLDNFEKVEECLEAIRSDLKDVIKKIYSFSTLDMNSF